MPTIVIIRPGYNYQSRTKIVYDLQDIHDVISRWVSTLVIRVLKSVLLSCSLLIDSFKSRKSLFNSAFPLRNIPMPEPVSKSKRESNKLVIVISMCFCFQIALSYYTHVDPFQYSGA